MYKAMPPITENVVANPISILCKGYSSGITEAIIAQGTKRMRLGTVGWSVGHGWSKTA